MSPVTNDGNDVF